MPKEWGILWGNYTYCVSSTYHMASSALLAHLFPLAQIILQKFSNLWHSVGVAIAVAILTTHRVAVPIGAIVTSVTIVTGHSEGSRVGFAAMVRHIKKPVATVPQATFHLCATFPVISRDFVSSSAGLNFTVQLENENRGKFKQKLQKQCTETQNTSSCCHSVY